MSHGATGTTIWQNLGALGVTLGERRAPKVGKKIFFPEGQPEKNCVTTNCVFWGPYSVKRPENTFGLRENFFLFDGDLDLACLAGGGQLRGFDHVWVVAARTASQICPIVSNRLFEHAE